MTADVTDSDVVLHVFLQSATELFHNDPEYRARVRKEAVRLGHQQARTNAWNNHLLNLARTNAA